MSSKIIAAALGVVIIVAAVSAIISFSSNFKYDKDINVTDNAQVKDESSFDENYIFSHTTPDLSQPTLTQIGDNVYYTADGNTVTISGTGDMWDFDLLYNTSPFYCNSSIENIIIEYGVTNIGKYVFEKCSSLTSIIIPDSVTNICGNAFSNCTGLTSITIPDSIINIEYSAFFNTGLTSITIPDSVTNIEYAVFSKCINLTNIMMPDSVESIGVYSFSYCENLTSITIPDSVTIIDICAFSHCKNLTKVTIPDSVESIGENAFSDCGNVTVCCRSGSAAEQYAKDNEINYEII